MPELSLHPALAPYQDKIISAIAAANLIRPGPVSYTHLDVYKRQVQFLVDPLQRRFGNLAGGQPFAKPLHVSSAVILGDAEFLLDDLELLAQKKLALMLAHLCLLYTSRCV